MNNPRFTQLLKKMEELHDKKLQDYADVGNPYSNFEYAAQVAAPFEGVHKVFATLLGVKLARKAQLLSGKIPKNESLLDTFIDESNYDAIWTSYFMMLLEADLKDVYNDSIGSQY